MYRCPECKATDQIDITIKTSARLVQPEGREDEFETDCDMAENRDHEWDDDSEATCMACQFRGTMDKFNESEAADPPETWKCDCGRIYGADGDGLPTECECGEGVPDCTCAEESWYGEEHSSNCPLEGTRS